MLLENLEYFLSRESGNMFETGSIKGAE
jgi:hypothetical protein